MFLLIVSTSSEKIRAVRELADRVSKDTMIEVDGGIKSHNIREASEAGADILVAGSAVFRGASIKENINGLRKGLES